MSRYTSYAVVIATFLAGFGTLAAQNPNGLIGPAEAARFGLQRMWFTQIEVDVARGRLKHLTQHVSSTKGITVFEVVYNGRKFVYRETDLDKFGRVIGKDEAKKLAEIKINDLKERQIDAKLNTVVVPEITLYAVTDAALVHAVDAETGRTKWKASVGSPRHPTVSAGANDQFVATVNGSEIYVLNAQTGELVWQRRVNGAPGAGPAVTDTMVFVPMIDGAMEAYDLSDPQTPPVIFQSHGRAMVQPIFTGTNVAWPTDRGHLYVSGGTNHRINFRLEANNDIVAPAAAFPPRRIIAASIDGFIYCVQETAGSLMWRFSAGQPIVTSPVPYGDTVYAVTEDRWLFAIDGELGLERWSIPRMTKIVGASTDRLYCLDEVNRLTIIDRKSGSRFGSLSTEFDDFPYANRESDRIILGTSDGMIQCLREISQDYPLIHIQLAEPPVEAPKKPVRRQATESTDGEMEANPFGGGAPAAGAEADPFGSGASEKPATPASEPTEDPFG